MLDQKVHYKMYKSGSKWIFAAITAVTIGIGIGQMGTSAKADESQSSDAAVSTTISVDSGSTGADDQNSTQNSEIDSAQTANSRVDQAKESSTDTKTDTSTDTKTDTSTAAVQDTQTENSSSNTTTTQTTQNPNNAAQPITPRTTMMKALETTPTDFSTSLTLTDAQQTQTVSSEDNLSSTAVVNTTDMDDLALTYTVANNTDIENLKIDTWLQLPFTGTVDNKYLVLDPDTTLASFMDTLPSSLHVGFSIVPGTYLDYATLMTQTNNTFTWDQLKAIQITGTLNPGESYTVKLPIKLNSNNPLDPLVMTDTEADVGNYSMQNEDSMPSLNMNISLVQPVQLKLDGHYIAYLLDAASDNDSAQLATKAIQALMPTIQPSQVIIQNVSDPNFNTGVYDSSINLSNTQLLSGGFWGFPAKLIQDALAGTGYAVNNAFIATLDGQPTTVYMYAYNAGVPGNMVIAPSTDGLTYSRDMANADGYVGLLDAMNGHDSTINADSTTKWNDFDQFDGLNYKNNGAWQNSNVTASISDPEGVLTSLGDGNYKFNKSGKYTVTYTLALSNGINVTKDAVVTVTYQSDSGTGSNNGNGSQPNGGDTGNNGGSTTTGTNPTDNAGNPTTGNTITGNTTGGTTTSNEKGQTTSGESSTTKTKPNGQSGSVETVSTHGNVVTKVGQRDSFAENQNSQETKSRLPQTNEGQNLIGSVIGLALLGILSAFGLIKKPRHND